MAYFEPDFLDFFKELAANNHKDWFDDNRDRYHKIVKDPFKAYIADVINEIRKEDPKLGIEPSEAIFRINRDIRFSKEKIPYKNHVSAIVSRNGRKDKSYPGLYIQFDAEKASFFGGAYQLSPQQTAQMRQAIADNLTVFEKLLHADDFKSAYGKVHGEKAKRIPKDLQAKAEEQPLLFNKSLYYFTELPPETVLADDLLQTTMHYYYIGRPMMQFLERKVFG